MNKGFKIICNNCGSEINAITHEGDKISVVILPKYDSHDVGISCNCGNEDKDN